MGIDSHPASFTAAADLTTKYLRFGKFTSTGLNVCTVAGERADSVIGGHFKKTPIAGDAVDGYIDRVVQIEAGGTVAIGDALTTDTLGRAVTAGAADCVNAICTKGATVGAFCEALPRFLSLPAGFGGASLVTSGAIPVNVRLVELSITGPQALTLANGTATGQILDIECTVAATSPVGTLTIATPFGTEAAVYIFHAVGQALRLCWDGTAWKFISKKLAGTLAVVVGTTVLTNFHLTETFSLSVTATVHSTGTKGIPAPQMVGEYIRIVTGTAASSPVGDIDIAGFTKALVAATSLAAINATTCTATFISNGVSWDNSQLTTATYA